MTSTPTRKIDLPRSRNRYSLRKAITSVSQPAEPLPYRWVCSPTGLGGYWCTFYSNGQYVLEVFSDDVLEDSDPPYDPEDSNFVTHQDPSAYDTYLGSMTATETVEVIEDVFVVDEHFFESTYPGSCSCQHYKVTRQTPNHTVYFTEGSPTKVLLSPGTFSMVFRAQDQRSASMSRLTIPEFVRIFVDRKRGQLVWDSLPSSSDFGLVQFLAELDDTIGAFSLEFFKKLFSFKDGWGTFEWGILPLVSDIRGLISAYRNRHVDMSHFPLEFEKSFRDHGYKDLEIKNLKIKYTGHATSLADPYLEFLDRIGLHFDVSIVWDLIPLSFVIDYILPIGDMLGSITNGGWVRSVDFQGWCVLSFDVIDYSLSSESPSSIHCFERYYVKEVLTVPYLDENNVGGIQLPSIRQMWNMLYIFLS